MENLEKGAFCLTGFNRITQGLKKLPSMDISHEQYDDLKAEIQAECKKNGGTLSLIEFLLKFVRKAKEMNIVLQSRFICSHSSILKLCTGETVLIRPIVPSDKEILVDSLPYASPRSLFFRFMHPIKRLSPDQLDYLTNVDFFDHFAFSIVENVPPYHRGVAVARYIRDFDDPELAEWAVIVTDGYQSKSIGSALLYAISSIASQNGIKRFGAVVHPTNIKILNGLKKLKAVKMVRHGSTYHIFDLPVYPEFVKDPKVRQMIDVAVQGTSLLVMDDYVQSILRKDVKYTSDVICNVDYSNLT